MKHGLAANPVRLGVRPSVKVMPEKERKERRIMGATRWLRGPVGFEAIYIKSGRKAVSGWVPITCEYRCRSGTTTLPRSCSSYL